MGWSSATEIFDGAVDVALHFIPWDGNKQPPGILAQAVVEKMYKDIDWGDWDTQDESIYADELTQVRIDMGELDPEDFD